jgi:hypothetical protein
MRSSFSTSSLQGKLAQQKAALASREKDEALKRLRDAESSLKEALDELNASADGNSLEIWYTSIFHGKHHKCPHLDSCIANCIGSFCQSFLLAYGVRVGIGVLLRAFKLAKNKSYKSILNLKVWFFIPASL